jgi:hypothetical protein
VQEVCLHEEGGGFGEELADLETGLQANRICAGERKVQREGLRARSTCFGLQVMQRAGFRQRYEKA